ncbi:MAG: MarR family winged helix-turn-helix transcriptional regulator [Ignavibacteriaceae bacterium]
MKSHFDPIHQQQNIESKIVSALERISEAFRVLLWKESNEYSLSPIQIQIIIFLFFQKKESRTVSKLAKEFNLTKATVSDSIKKLEEKKLIIKKNDLNDSRSYTIELTNDGKNIAKKVSLFADEFTEPIYNLTDEQKEILLKSLLDLIYKFNQAGIITIQRMCLTCRFYSKKSSSNHYCNLLELPLKTSELRIDCPEHQAKIVA